MQKQFWQLLTVVAIALTLAACAGSKGKPTTLNSLFHGAFGSGTATSELQPHQANVHSSVMFNNMNDYWQHARTANVAGVEITTFVPSHESAANWSRRLEVTHTRVKPNMSARKYYNRVVKSDFGEQCYSQQARLRVLHHHANDLMYEAQMINCGKLANKVVIGRIMRAQHSISSISYTVKAANVSPYERDQMLGLIAQAKVIRD